MDHDALPALLDVMEAAGYHDLDRVKASLGRADDALGKGFHQSRAAVDRSRTAAVNGQWQSCWAAAMQATHTLTGPFPPDVSKCPPRPDDTKPLVRDAVCACGVTLPAGARFCAMCGTPATVDRFA